MSGFFLRRRHRRSITAAARWAARISLVGMGLLLLAGIAWASHCPPDDSSRSDCKEAAKTARNPLVPIGGAAGGGLIGLIAQVAVGGAVSAGPSVSSPEKPKEPVDRCVATRANYDNYVNQVTEATLWWERRCESLRQFDESRADQRRELSEDRQQIWQDKFTLYRVLAVMQAIAPRAGHMWGAVADYLLMRVFHFHPTDPRALAAMLALHVELSHQIQHQIYDPRIKELSAEADAVGYRLKNTAIRLNLKIELAKTWTKHREKVAQSLRDNLKPINDRLERLHNQHLRDWSYLNQHCRNHSNPQVNPSTSPLGDVDALGRPPTVELPDLTDPVQLAEFELDHVAVDTPAPSAPGHH